MNIFILDQDPQRAARQMCDKHIPKMCVESLQMMGSALRRHGANDDQMPLSEAGKPIKGGYKNHPATRWAGDSRVNFLWLAEHGLELCAEYTLRYGKVHKCQHKIEHMTNMCGMVPVGSLTPFAQCMPDEYRHTSAVQAYRTYYNNDKAYFAKWDKGREAPSWWLPVQKEELV